jgi:N-terminal domain of anti-restriction factor ArdC
VRGGSGGVRVRSQAGLARLSLSNQLLVALARPDAAFVAGFKAWLSLGYFVRKNERAIRIIAPMPVKQRDRDTGETRILFKTVFVFDRAQVTPLPNGEPTPLEPPCEPLTGDSHAHLLAPLQAFARSLGFSVAFEPIAGPAGAGAIPRPSGSSSTRLRPPTRSCAPLIHEVVHAMGVGYGEYGRERAEVIVDTATHLACASVGLRVDGESIPYVAGWGEDGALEAVTEFAKTIDALARRVEEVLAVEAVPLTA